MHLDPLYLNDNEDKSVNLHCHVNVTEATATELSKAISTVRSNIGLGGTMVGVGTTIGKSTAKSGIPLLQKAVIVLAGSEVLLTLLLVEITKMKLF